MLYPSDTCSGDLLGSMIIEWYVATDSRVVIDIVELWRASCPQDDGVGILLFIRNFRFTVSQALLLDLRRLHCV